MITISRTVALVATALALGGCQTSQSRQSELETICSDPYNRQAGSFYFDECQSLYPRTDQQLQQDYKLGAPAAG